jgi:chemotaxis protein methyltransferase CheR
MTTAAMRNSLHPIEAGPLGAAFGELKSVIVNATGHARLAARDDLLLDKIARRIACNALPSLAAYLDLLKHGGAAGKAEFDSLIAELTIGETSFFRHPEHFDALRDHVLPACLRRNAATRQLRIWSAGCANGAEAYSIAILVQALLGDRLADWNVVIVGSDINRVFLAEAERGLYTDWTLREVPDEQRAAFFTRQGGNWAIRGRYRSRVRFVTHNLASDEFPCLYKNIFSFDVVMCRNVMIYFDHAFNVRLADRLKSVLVEDGWLFAGPTDFNPRLEQNFALEKLSGALVYHNRLRPAVAVPPPAAVARAHAATSPPQPAIHPRTSVPTGRKPRRPRVAQDAPTQPSIDTLFALANKGDWITAARYCEAFLAADSCNAPAHYYYALVQHYSGATDKAEQALRRALYLDRNFALAHYQLGLMRKDAGDTAQCGRSFRNVLGVLSDLPDDRPVSPCGRIAAIELRELATQQLALLPRSPEDT